MPGIPRTARAARRWLLCAACLSLAASAADNADDRIRITLGDYRFEPSQITLHAGLPVVLELVNSDAITPHNFTLRDAGGGFDIDVDVGPGETREIILVPAIDGSYGFHCNKKLPFLKSHRARGMEGTLHVVSP